MLKTSSCFAEAIDNEGIAVIMTMSYTWICQPLTH